MVALLQYGLRGSAHGFGASTSAGPVPFAPEHGNDLGALWARGLTAGSSVLNGGSVRGQQFKSPQ